MGALLVMASALLILIAAGLPERADFTSTTVPGRIPVAPELNAAAPNFELVDINGQRIRLAERFGAPVIVNFWATWCEPCRIEMPILQAVYERFSPYGLRILAVNLGEAPGAVREWQQAFGLTYNLLLDPSQAVAALYRLRGQPSTFIIAPSGIITQIFYGPASAETLEAALQNWTEQATTP